MANTKITALTAQTNGNIAPTTDLTVTVDVSDTTMASTGTDKSQTLDEAGAFYCLVNLVPSTSRTIQANYSVVAVGEYQLGAAVELIFSDPSEMAVI